MANLCKKMRRRSRMKVLKILQSFSQGTFIAFLLLLFGADCMGAPGYLDFDNLPETNFTCAGKVIGGYYADLEASCQMFHVCTIGQGDEPMDIKFLCLNGTVFDQETRVCERVDEVDCSKSEKFYYLNLELYGNTIIPSPEEGSSEEDGSDGGDSSSTTSTSTTTSTTTTTTTARPATTTTQSRRFIFNNSNGNKGFTQPISSSTIATPMHAYSSTSPKNPSDEEDYEYEDEEYGEEKPADQDSVVVPALEEDGSFSPQQFTLQQQQQQQQQQGNQPKTEPPTKAGGVKPAVSFQQQHFQNGGTLAVTNSHVTVTTHTTGGANGGQTSGGNNDATPTSGTKSKPQSSQPPLTHKQKAQLEHQKRQQQEQLLQQQAITKQHEELQKRQQEAAVKQQQKAYQQQQKQVQQHEAEIKNHQALLLLHTQKINRQQQKPNVPPSSAPPATQRPSFATGGGPSGFGVSQQQQQQQQTQAPKRIPLLASSSPLALPSPASPLTPFRLRAQGFKLPPSVAPQMPPQQRQDILRQQQHQLQQQQQQQQQQQHHHHQEERFEGYRRQPPPQVPLHLPFEQQLRNQKDISLQFDPDVEDLTQIPQHKELKRSDPPFHNHKPGGGVSSQEHSSGVTGISERKIDGNLQPQQSQQQQQQQTEVALGGQEQEDPVVEYEYDDDYSSEGDEPEPGNNPSLDSVKSNTNSEFVIAKNASPGKGGEDRNPKELTSVTSSDGRTNTNPSASSSSNSRSSSIGGSSSSNSGSVSNYSDRSSKKSPSSSSSSSSSSTSNTSRFIINNEHHKSSSSPPRVQPSARSGVSPVPPVSQPKVIVTTSTSIRDNHGRTINYSITSNGGSISSTVQPGTTTVRVPKAPQSSVRGYDEYKESDVLSDPFFLDVPRTGNVGARSRRSLSTSAKRSRRKRYMLLVPLFM
uniref:Chitin-binding type-2 domain-containing protein n=1 Tax=Anopheles atroparvus TaxID=41427 RepID=A0AAG5DMZ8_ANOAO